VAQEAFPAKPIKIVVPFGAGASANDIAARALAQGPKESQNWSVIVENKPGASGVIGLEYVKGSAADGYTLCLFTSGFTILPAMQSLPFAVDEDFEPIGIFMTVPFFLFAHQSVNVKDIQGLVDLAKANPNKLNYAIPGIGQPHHLAMELLMKVTGTQFFVVPYSSGIAAAIPDVIKGRVALMMGTVSSMAPHMKTGLVKALGTTGPKRSTLLPEVPPIAETVPGYQVEVWTGFAAPKGTPKEIVAKLNAAFVSAVPHIAERLKASGMESASTSPEQMGAAVRSDMQKWRKLVQEAGIKTQ
jgi:tripartite-type tricarboxylate transporter receptor subunit TctC